MANRLFDLGRQAFLSGSIAWGTDTIKVIGLNSGYVPNSAAHQFLSDVVGAANVNVVAAGVALSSKTATAGVANAASADFGNIASGTITYLVIYKDTTVAATSPLIALIDTATNLPVTGNGGDISITWDTGANKIFKL
jgi:hypothetical protein